MKRFLAMLIAAATLTFGGMAHAEEPEPFDLNKATVEQLMAIPDANITEELAKAIIDYAKKTPFKFSDDLMKVPGLDNSTFEAMMPVEENDSVWYDPGKRRYGARSLQVLMPRAVCREAGGPLI